MTGTIGTLSLGSAVRSTELGRQQKKSGGRSAPDGIDVPSQQCWYSFAAEYTDANWGKMKLPNLQKQTMPSVGIEPTTLES